MPKITAPNNEPMRYSTNATIKPKPKESEADSMRRSGPRAAARICPPSKGSTGNRLMALQNRLATNNSSTVLVSIEASSPLAPSDVMERSTSQAIPPNTKPARGPANVTMIRRFLPMSWVCRQDVNPPIMCSVITGD